MQSHAHPHRDTAVVRTPASTSSCITRSIISKSGAAVSSMATSPMPAN
jgi:hypothetical protein